MEILETLKKLEFKQIFTLLLLLLALLIPGMSINLKNMNLIENNYGLLIFILKSLIISTPLFMVNLTTMMLYLSYLEIKGAKELEGIILNSSSYATLLCFYGSTLPIWWPFNNIMENAYLLSVGGFFLIMIVTFFLKKWEKK